MTYRGGNSQGWFSCFNLRALGRCCCLKWEKKNTEKGSRKLTHPSLKSFLSLFFFFFTIPHLTEEKLSSTDSKQAKADPRPGAQDSSHLHLCSLYSCQCLLISFTLYILWTQEQKSEILKLENFPSVYWHTSKSGWYFYKMSCKYSLQILSQNNGFHLG